MTLAQEILDGPFTEDDYSLYSDLYKDDTGIRPRGHDFANYGEFQAWLDRRDEAAAYEALVPPKSWTEEHTNNPFAILEEL